eukprot:Hpha_TRINITY_DN15887_c1_g4::TRINITY_DN15887_c1_g4_i3::g.189705::m.189705
MLCTGQLTFFEEKKQQKRGEKGEKQATQKVAERVLQAAADDGVERDPGVLTAAAMMWCSLGMIPRAEQTLRVMRKCGHRLASPIAAELEELSGVDEAQWRQVFESGRTCQRS